jgi:hypothetical protein
MAGSWFASQIFNLKSRDVTAENEHRNAILRAVVCARAAPVAQTNRRSNFLQHILIIVTLIQLHRRCYLLILERWLIESNVAH